MAEPYLGQIILFAGNFAPRGYALCNGQLMSIAQNTALFSILGTSYGGDGQTTFGLPDLRGRVPLSFGQGPGLSPNSLGQVAGTENVTLIASQLPQHTHNMMASSDPPSVGSAQGNSLGSAPRGSATGNIYAPGTTNQVPMGSSTAAGPAGGGQPHSNMQPYLVLNYCIALQGIFPSRN